MQFSLWVRAAGGRLMAQRWPASCHAGIGPAMLPDRVCLLGLGCCGSAAPFGMSAVSSQPRSRSRTSCAAVHCRRRFCTLRSPTMACLRSSLGKCRRAPVLQTCLLRGCHGIVARAGLHPRPPAVNSGRAPCRLPGLAATRLPRLGPTCGHSGRTVCLSASIGRCPGSRCTGSPALLCPQAGKP